VEQQGGGAAGFVTRHPLVLQQEVSGEMPRKKPREHGPLLWQTLNLLSGFRVKIRKIVCAARDTKREKRPYFKGLRALMKIKNFLRKGLDIKGTLTLTMKTRKEW
jgi:hypothetical protein